MSSINHGLVNQMEPWKSHQIRLLRSQVHRPMLVYFLPETAASQARWLEEGRRNAERLVKAWERMLRPVAFVGETWRLGFASGSASVGRPRPGDLYFAISSGSLLRDRNFQCLDSDLGAPALVLAGGSVEQTILPTAVDCALNTRPAFVASDAIFSRSPEMWGDIERAVQRSIISNYANVLTTKELINER